MEKSKEWRRNGEEMELRERHPPELEGANMQKGIHVCPLVEGGGQIQPTHRANAIMARAKFGKSKIKIIFWDF